MYRNRIALILLMFAFCNFSKAVSATASTEILWDTFGVPHVYGKNLESMYYGLGWAQMHNHADLLLQLYGRARGRAAEYWGADYLPMDRKTRLFEIPDRADKICQHPEFLFRDNLNAFVQGINDYASAHPEKIGAAFKQVLPVMAQDVVAHALVVVYLEFLSGEDFGVTDQMLRPGSNAYAIGPSRSASGKAMLLANPHLPWSDFYTFFEAQLNAPGFQAYGVTLVGFPVMVIAFNDHLGWTHTVNTIDATDRYSLQLDGEGYLLDGKHMVFDQRVIQLKVRQQDGSYREQPLLCKYSRHGPVLERQRSNKAFAIRIAGMDNRGLFYQWHQMAAAKNRQQFEAALKLMQLPMFNVVYADDAGNISYHFAGNVPRRSSGDWDFWHNTIDGSQSVYIWEDIHGYKDMPSLLNPASGFIQNSNDPPWSSTFPGAIAPKDFPAYMSPQEMSLRSQRSVGMIVRDPHITYLELIDYKFNTRMEAADRFLDDLLAAVALHTDSIALEAAAVLKKWDLSADTSSRGAVLFTRWFDKLDEQQFLHPWTPADRINTPDGLKNPQKAVALLVAAAKQVKQEYGRLDVPWGQVNRFRMNGKDLPGNGANEKYGVFRTVYYVPDNDGKQVAVAGDSYVAVTTFGKKVEARVMLGYGNASQPGNKHRDDQLQLLSSKQLRTPWLQKADVLKHLEERELLNADGVRLGVSMHAADHTSDDHPITSK